MMTATPNDVRFANDAWLRHIWRQTSHHCGTEWNNIIFAKQMHHIDEVDASLTKQQRYAIINLSNNFQKLFLQKAVRGYYRWLDREK